eukprot:5706707-Lingulodinium_polyedra.AAC.1
MTHAQQVNACPARCSRGAPGETNSGSQRAASARHAANSATLARLPPLSDLAQRREPVARPVTEMGPAASLI